MNNLTYIQRVAAKAEICNLFSAFSRHDADTPYVCFVCLTMYDPEYFEDIQEILKDFVDETTIKKVSFYIQSRVVPYDLWVSKVLLDIDWLIDKSDDEEDEAFKENLCIVRSIFFNYIDKLSSISLYACHLLLGSILSTEKLKVLHEDAFYLQCNTKLPVTSKTLESTESCVPIEKYLKDCGIFGISFIGTEPLCSMNLEGATTSLEEDISDESIYDGLRETFKSVDNTSYFVVEKREISSGNSVSVRSFVDLERVIEYLKSVPLMGDDGEQSPFQYVVIEVEKTSE